MYHICACVECGAWPVKSVDGAPRMGLCPDGHRVPAYVTEAQYTEAFEGKNDQCGTPGCERPVEAPGFKRCRPCIVLGAKQKRRKAS